MPMTDPSPTWMQREIAEIAAAAERLARPENRARSQRIAAELRAISPPVVLTVARGSSAHAATYLGSVIQKILRIPTAHVGPSISTVYNVDLQAQGLVALALSQSGTSADIVQLAASLKWTGGHVVALTNTTGSPLAKASSRVLDIAAGPENAVAATKSYANSIIAGLWLIADWGEDEAMGKALERLPEALAAASAGPEILQAAQLLSTAEHAVILGRGPGLGLANECALKLLETCRISAVSYSGAEVLHGPSTVLRDGFPVIALRTGAGAGMDQVLSRLAEQGAAVVQLPVASGTGHRLVDPLLDLPPLYEMIEALSRARGLDPDRPADLEKATKTV